VRVLQLANPSADVALGQISEEDRMTIVIFTTEGEDEISAEDILNLIEGQPIDSWWMDLALSAMQAEASKKNLPAGVGAAWLEKEGIWTGSGYHVEDRLKEWWAKSGMATVHPVKLSSGGDDHWALFYGNPKPDPQGHPSGDLVTFRKGAKPMTQTAVSSLEKILDVLRKDGKVKAGEPQEISVPKNPFDRGAIVLGMVARWLRAIEASGKGADGKGADARPEKVKIVHQKYRWKIARAVYVWGSAMSAIREIESYVGAIV
jgi:hypothetical protein